MRQIRGVTLLGGWKPAEIAHLSRILEPLPAAWLEENHHVKALVRRPVLTDGPATAPGHSKYDPVTGSIVVFDKGVYHGGKIDPEQFGRSVYHELAHTLLRLHPGLLDAWMHSTRGDGFVDDYARQGPDEDFADTFSELFLHTDEVQKRFPRKARFMRELIAQHGLTKKAIVGPIADAAAFGIPSLVGYQIGKHKGTAQAQRGEDLPYQSLLASFLVPGAFGYRIGQVRGHGEQRHRMEQATHHEKKGSAMGFMHAFTEELVKTAAGGMGALKGLGEMALSKAKTPLGKGLIGATALGGGGLAYGESRGKKQGFEQGTAQMDEGMTEAYKVGIRRGAQAMYQQIAQQMQPGESGQ